MNNIDDQWLYALAAVLIGIVVGAVAGSLARRWLANDKRRPAFQAVAVPASVFLFWLGTGTGVLFAIGANSPDTLRPIPAKIIDWLPNVLVAGLLILAGVAAAIAVSSTVGRALERTTGQKHAGVERSIRWTVTAGVSILALGQLGVRTDILLVIIGGVVGAAAITFALLAGLGGKEVASQLAISRTLQSELVPGSRINAAGVSGIIIDLHPTTVVVRTDTNKRVLISYSNLLAEPFEIELPSGKDSSESA